LKPTPGMPDVSGAVSLMNWRRSALVGGAA